MLNSRMRNAAAAARPVKASGVAAIRVWLSAPVDRKAASTICRSLERASWPVASRTIPASRKAKSSEPTGTANVSQRGCVRRRSICTRIVPSGHEQADLLDVRLPGGELAEDATLVHHDDPVGEREDLVEVLSDQEDADAGLRRLPQVPVDGLDRADVQSARRRGRHEQRRVAGKLAREH